MLKQRLKYGIPIGGGFALAMAFFPGPLLFLLLIGFSGACLREFYQMAKHGGYRVYDRLGLLLGGLWMLGAYLLATSHGVHQNQELLLEWEKAFLILISFVVLLRTMVDAKAKQAFETAAVTLLGVIYVPVMLSYYLRLAQWGGQQPWETTRAGVFLCFFLSLVVKISDTGAYAIGSRFGRHKMSPRISPAKSWEGLAGGLVTGVATGVLAAIVARRYEWGPAGIFWAEGGALPVLTLWHAAALSLLLVIVGVFGDLIESMFKRAVKVKDSGCIFSTIGGILDVIDSLIFAPPLMYFFLVWSGA